MGSLLLKFLFADALRIAPLAEVEAGISWAESSHTTGPQPAMLLKSSWPPFNWGLIAVNAG